MWAVPALVLVCPRCCSTERRPNGKGCAACNRRPVHPGLSRAEGYLFARLLKDDFDDVEVTEQMRAYLRAFDAYIKAGAARDLRGRRLARVLRWHTLATLEGPVTTRAA